jgi:hypothetical protein
MTLKRIVFFGILALLIAEGILRLTENSRNNFVGAMHPTSYFEHPLLGPIAGRPNYRGVINLPGERSSIWITLDDKGLRPVPSSSKTGIRIRVMGGASQTFGFAVPDAHTWPSRMTRSLGEPAQVEMLSLPGVSLEREWFSLIAGRTHMTEPNLIVLSLYREGIVFPVSDQIVKPRDLTLIAGLPEQLTPVELAIYPVSRVAFEIIKTINEFPAAVSVSRPAILFGRVRRALGVRTEKPAESDIPEAESSANVGGLRNFVARLGETTSPKGRVIVVILPSENLPPNHFRNLTRTLPSSVMLLDLHEKLIGHISSQDVTGDGHYRADLNDVIGKAVASALCQGTDSHPKLIDGCRAPGIER